MATLTDTSITRINHLNGAVRYTLQLTIETADGTETTAERDTRIVRNDSETFEQVTQRMLAENAGLIDDVLAEVEFDGDSPAVHALVQYHRGQIEAWSAPTGAHDAPNLGDLRTHQGSIWASTMDGNTTEPDPDNSISEWDHITDLPTP